MDNSSTILTNNTDYDLLTTPDPYLLSLYYQSTDQLWLSVGITLLIFGTVGHILSIIVMMSSRSMRERSSTVYTICLAFSGILALYTGLVRKISQVNNNWSYDLRNQSDIVCKIHTMLSYLSLQYIAWLQASISIDRVIAAWLPYMYKSLSQWKKGMAVASIELVALLSLNSIVLIAVGTRDDGYCGKVNSGLVNAWFYIDLLNYSLLPAAIIIISNSLILYKIFTSRFGKRMKSRSVTFMLMIVNCMFLISTLPISIMAFLNWRNISTLTNAKLQLAYAVCSLLQYLGTASTFFIYCITGEKFRKQLKLLLGKILCREKCAQTTITTNETSAN